MRLKALIWDVDGTMVDSEELHRAAFNQAFAERGLDWLWDHALYTELLETAGGRERIRRFREMAAVPQALPEDDVDALHMRKTRLFGELLRSGSVHLRPGVRRLLAEARDKGIGLAIATTTSRANVRVLLDGPLSGMDLAWDAVVTGEDVASKKPSPQAHLLALSRLGLVPDSCLALEDSRNGLRAALGAGLRTVITVNGYTKGHDFSGAFAVLTHLGDPGDPGRVLDGPPFPKGRVTVEHLDAWFATPPRSAADGRRETGRKR